MTTVLVTCAGSGVGQSAIDSLNLLREDRVIGCDSNRDVYAHNFCDVFCTVPSIYSDKYIDIIIELSVNNNVDLIIPGHDHELLLLSKNIDRFTEKKITVLVSHPDMIEISRDKYKWSQFFEQFDCPVVPTYRFGEFKKNPDPNIFPAIIKPSGGSASQGIFIVNALNELPDTNELDIIQPYLFPTPDDLNYQTIRKMVSQRRFVQMSEISIQLIFTTQSEFSGIFISKNTLKNGVPTFVDPIAPDSFEYLDDVMKFVPILIEKKVKGPVNIQGRITEKGLLCFEMNMRFTGITGNRAQLGFNEVSFLVDNFLEKSPKKLMGYSPNKVGARQVACTTVPREKQRNNIYSILGAGSFIGSYLVNTLLAQNPHNRLNLICREASYSKYQTMFPDERVRVLSEKDKMIETVYCQSDVLINLASALAYEKDSEKYDAILFQHEQTLKITKANIPLILNISSQSVYDQTANDHKKEDAALAINSTYSFQKHFAEKHFASIKLFSPASNIVSLRFARVIGVHPFKSAPGGFFHNVIASLMQHKEINIPYPENNTNLIDVRDTVSAILHIVNTTSWKTLPAVFNVGGTNLSIRAYCDTVMTSLGLTEKKSLVHYSDQAEITASSMINSDLLANFGWSIHHPLEESIKEIAKTISVK